MKKMKSKVIYHGGSLPVPSHLQKGTIRLEEGMFHFHATGKSPKYDLDVSIPTANMKSAVAEERKYYSSVGYFLIIKYSDNDGRKEELELEIRSFVRRGRAMAVSRMWADVLSEKIQNVDKL